MTNNAHPTPGRILLVKLSSLGDIVHALPVAGALRATYPGARIAWAVEKKWLPLVEHHPDLDEVFTLDSFGLRRRPHRWGRVRADLRKLRSFKAEWALDLQGTLKSAVVTRCSGAGVRVGFAHAEVREWMAGMFYNTRVAPRSAHVVEQLLDVAEGLGPLRRKIEFPLPIPAAAQAEVDAWIERNRIPEFAFFSPGGGWMSKRWPSERYAALAELLEQQYGLAVVLNRGPGEAAMEKTHRQATEIRARIFSGDVMHLAAALRRARLAVGGDTGPLQLAAILGTPTVALFGPTDPGRNRPYSAQSAVVRKATATTYQRSATHSAAMLAITPEEAAAACGEVLACAKAGVEG